MPTSYLHAVSHYYKLHIRTPKQLVLLELAHITVSSFFDEIVDIDLLCASVDKDHNPYHHKHIIHMDQHGLTWSDCK